MRPQRRSPRNGSKPGLVEVTDVVLATSGLGVISEGSHKRRRPCEGHLIARVQETHAPSPNPNLGVILACAKLKSQ